MATPVIVISFVVVNPLKVVWFVTVRLDTVNKSVFLLNVNVDLAPNMLLSLYCTWVSAPAAAIVALDAEVILPFASTVRIPTWVLDP